MKNLLSYPSLLSHYTNIQSIDISSLFTDKNRVNYLTKRLGNLTIDFSKNLFSKDTISLFANLAEEIKLKDKIDNMFSGENINFTEHRAVLHTALRTNDKELISNEKNVIPQIQNCKQKVAQFVSEFRSNKIKGISNKNYTDIVNIGIGGSYLGVEMAYHALKNYDNPNNIKMHFIANIDGAATEEVLSSLNAETTLFVIASKTFTTAETMLNAENVKQWFIEKTKQNDLSKNFIALSSNVTLATKFGIAEKNVFEFWDFVGGRYSIWSSIGLPLALIIGNEGFKQFLHGAYLVDENLKEEKLEQNIPFLLAILGIWYNNLFGYKAYCILPYSYQLRHFVRYVQQLDMESNGKSTNKDGKKISYNTGSLVFGEPGTDAQHSFFQFLHQGTNIIPCDFIGFIKPTSCYKNNHEILIANLFAQTEALMNGKSLSKVESELENQGYSKDEIDNLAPHKRFYGNRPSTTLLFDELNPQALGTLCALYEHKVFIQGIFWNINSFDQWGVELGKQLANDLIKDIKGDSISNTSEPSTINLINMYKNHKK